MTSSAYAKFPKRLGTGAETLLLVTTNVVISMFFASGMFSIAGALAKSLNVKVVEVMSPRKYLSLKRKSINSLFFQYMVCIWD